MYKREKIPCTYILGSDRNGTLYVGVTSNLVARIFQHKNGAFEWFTTQYWVTNVLYYEVHDTMGQAITREKQIKKWNRAWKMRLIEEKNTEWEDLLYVLF